MDFRDSLFSDTPKWLEMFFQRCHDLIFLSSCFPVVQRFLLFGGFLWPSPDFWETNDLCYLAKMNEPEDVNSSFRLE